ncbi:MAG: zinc-ribbon domain-containing protein [Dehalococcoidia bacterium]|nr:zinc-ribbon domain-containing protein [Dehalococcoidia bacterium]
MYCPRCGHETKENEVYCERCGYKLPQKIAAVEQRFCVRCRAELRKEEKFCSSCGTRIGEVGPENAVEVKYPHQLATVLGYVFGFLGGWLGLIFGIYLLTREHPRAKYHGKIVLIVTIVMIIFWMFIWLA